jgi:PTS system mannose-specific IIA component
MYGGTPSNISLSFLGEKKIEVITGVNLPMLLKLATYSNDMNLEELASFITDYGQRNINLASDVLKKRVDKKKG